MSDPADLMILGLQIALTFSSLALAISSLLLARQTRKDLDKYSK
jgi:hypothetical protein